MNLRVEKLSFGYGSMIVGNDVSFTLDAGEVLCLLGPNGAGKTTLFKTILGLVPPLGGTVMADGAAIHQWSRQSLARVFGYVPQAQVGFFPFTIREVVLMGRTARIASTWPRACQPLPITPTTDASDAARRSGIATCLIRLNCCR